MCVTEPAFELEGHHNFDFYFDFIQPFQTCYFRLYIIVLTYYLIISRHVNILMYYFTTSDIISFRSTQQHNKSRCHHFGEPSPESKLLYEDIIISLFQIYYYFNLSCCLKVSLFNLSFYFIFG